MLNFLYDAAPSRVLFGEGTLERLPDEVDRLGAKRALVLSTPEQRGQAEDVARGLGERAVGVYGEAVMHVPIEVAEAAREEARRLGADCTIAIGGGSTVGLAKAIALDPGLPIIAVPTTFAGSEVTSIWGMTAAGLKTTGLDARVKPKTVIYDPTLTLSLPASIAGPSGINALAHAVEALYAQDANPIASLMAAESIAALARSLPKVVAEPGNLEARADALYGAWLAASAMSMVGIAIHHKLCHTLGGTFNLPHAEVHTVILPYAVAYNRDAAPEAMERIARAIGAEDPAAGIWELCHRIGAKTALKDIGMPAEGLDKAADLAVANPYYNPKPVTREGVRALLEDAYHGERPRRP